MAVRGLNGFWHRACWLDAAERRRPELERVRRRGEDRLLVAELLLRHEERGGSGFEPLGALGASTGHGADNSPFPDHILSFEMDLAR